MDVTPYLEVMHPAPRVLFESLEARRTRPRFMLPTPDGDWQAITWGAFAREVEEVTLALESLGLEREDRATIFGYNSVSWMSAALAIQAAGGAMVPIYPSSTAQQAIYVITHSDARVLFIDSQAHLCALLEHRADFALGLLAIIALGDDVDIASAIDSLPDEAHSLDAAQRAHLIARFHTWSQARAMGQKLAHDNPARIMELLEAIDLDQPAVMLYTSGTTGAPKGVPLTHRNIGVNGQDWLECNAPLLEEGYVDLLWLPLSHIFGFGEVCLGNTLGFVTYWSSPLRVLSDLPLVKPEVFMSVPRLFEKLATSAMEASKDSATQRARLDEVTGGNLKFCLSGGAGLKPGIKQFLHDHDMLIIEGYGLTEASPTLTLNRPDDFRFDSVGKPLPSVELKLADDGEILARGPSIFHGYHKNEKATAETFTEDGWLLTGDVGRWTEDGFLQIIDRKKEILVTAGGKNIPPANIEVNFRDESFIAHLVVYGDGKPYLTAGVWLDEALVTKRLGEHDSLERRRELVQECIDRVNASLPRHETIKKFMLMSEPLTVEGGLITPTLKVKRKKVYEHFASDFEALYQ